MHIYLSTHLTHYPSTHYPSTHLLVYPSTRLQTTLDINLPPSIHDSALSLSPLCKSRESVMAESTSA